MAENWSLPDLLATKTPGTPAAGFLRYFAGNFAGRLLARIMGPSGLDVTLQPHLARNKVGRWSAPGTGSANPGIDGVNAPSTVGTATGRAVTVINRFTRMKRLGYVSLATAGALAGQNQSSAQHTIGNGAGEGGFHAFFRFGCSDAATVAGARSFVGFSSSVAAPANVEPSTLTNCIGVGAGAADTNLRLYFGGSAAQPSIDLGADFPANTLSTDPYELCLFAAPGNQNVGWRVENLRTGIVAEAMITNVTPGTTLPLNSTLLAYRAWRCNNATALAVGIDIIGFSIETDY